MLPKERQALEDMLDQAQTVIKKAHDKGVELEGILEVNSLITLFQYIIYNYLHSPAKKHLISTLRKKLPWK